MTISYHLGMICVILFVYIPVAEKGPVMCSPSDTLDGAEGVLTPCPVCGQQLQLAVEVSDRPRRHVPCRECGHLVWFEKRMVGDVVVLDVFTGKTVGSEQIERASSALLRSGDVRRIILNLSSVKFASSSFIAGLVALHKKLRTAEGKLVLCELRPVVREVLHGARLDKFFDIADDEQKALDSL